MTILVGIRQGLCLLAISLMVSGCMGYPPTISPVGNFEVDRYLGTWYEIARLDHSFERGLEKVSAEYSVRDDGGIRVINRGYSPEKRVWKEAEGRAYFVEGQQEGYLKVSFFGPFYSSYVIFGLDYQDYGYAYVSGPDNSFLWLLARKPDVEELVVEQFIREAERSGFPTGKLIYVNHE